MTVPYLHTTASALTVSEETLVWATATRRGSRLCRLTVHEEAIGGDGPGAALGRLVARVCPTAPFVAVHLDPAHVRHLVLDGPPFDDQADYDAWIAAEAARHVPAQALEGNVVLRTRLLSATADHTRCLLALASRKAVAAREALLEAAGLQALSVGSLEVATGSALMLRPDFARGATAVLALRRAEGTLLRYRDGHLHALLPLAAGARDPDAALQETAALAVPPPDRLVVVGPEASTLVAQAEALGGPGCPVVEAVLDLRPAAAPVTAAWVPAVALVLEQLAPAGEALNVLEPGAVRVRRQALEQRTALRSVVALSALVGVLYVLVVAASFFVGGRRTAAEERLVVLAGEAARLDRARSAVRTLEADLIEAHRLLGARTDAARLLRAVGRTASEGLWLDALVVEDTALTLRGAAFDEGGVAAYLDRLDEAAFATGARLAFTETIRAKRHYPRTPVHDRTLTRFEIQATLPALAARREASP